MEILTEATISDIQTYYDSLSSKEKIKVNNTVLEFIGKFFGRDFARFLIKDGDVKSIIRTIELGVLLKQYYEGDKSKFDPLFIILMNPLLDYFFATAFGFKNDLRKLVPFKLGNPISTGNSDIDKIISFGLAKTAYSTDAMKLYKIGLQQTFEDIFETTVESIIFKDLFEEYQRSENILAELSIRNFRRDLKDLWGKWTNKEKRGRLKLLNSILDNLPKINRDLREHIRKEVFTTKIDQILLLNKNLNSKSLSKIISKSIIEYLIDQVRLKRFSNQVLKKFLKVFEIVINRNQNLKIVNAGLEVYIQKIIDNKIEPKR